MEDTLGALIRRINALDSGCLYKYLFESDVDDWTDFECMFATICVLSALGESVENASRAAVDSCEIKLARELLDDVDRKNEAARFLQYRLRDRSPVCLIHIKLSLSMVAYAMGTIVPALLMQPRAKDLSSVQTYVVRNPSNGLIRIAKSIDVDQRTSSLELGAGSELEILAVFDGDIEKELLDRFSSLRKFGAWFEDDGSIASHVRQLDAKRTVH